MHVDIEPTQIGRVFAPDYGIVSDAKAALELFVAAARDAGRRPDRAEWAQQCQQRKQTMWRKTNFDDVPIKPQRVYEEMNRAFGKDVRYVSTIGLSQIQAAQLLHVFKPRHWINAGQAGPLGWTVPAALGVATADPDGTVVALSGDYDFQFMIEELAVGAQFNIPYIHVLVNNAYLGLIRQSQRGFDMDYCVQLSFDNINAPRSTATASTTSRWPRAWAARRSGSSNPTRSCPALEQAKKLLVEHRVPVVVEVILERVTNVSMGLEIDAVTEFEELAESGARRPDRALRQPGLRSVSRQDGSGSMARVLLAPDKFKGTLTAAQVAGHLAEGIHSVRTGRRDRHRARSPTVATACSTRSRRRASSGCRSGCRPDRRRRPTRVRAPRCTRRSSSWPRSAGWRCSARTKPAAGRR